MINPIVFIGEPIEFLSICKVYPPKVKDVIANNDFSRFLQVITLTQDDLDEECQKKEVKAITPFEFVLVNAYQDKKFKALIEYGFEMLIHESVTILPEKKIILIGDIKDAIDTAKSISDLRQITVMNYFDFQNCVRESMGKRLEEAQTAPDPNEDPRIRRMKELAKKRDRIKEKKGTANSIPLSACLVAICCMGIGITPLNIGEMSYASINPIMSMYQGYEKYHLDIDSLLAGADSKKIKPKYWIRDLDK